MELISDFIGMHAIFFLFMIDFYYCKIFVIGKNFIFFLIFITKYIVIKKYNIYNENIFEINNQNKIYLKCYYYIYF